MCVTTCDFPHIYSVWEVFPVCSQRVPLGFVSSRPSLTLYLGSGLCALCGRAGRGLLYPRNPQGTWTRGGFTHCSVWAKQGQEVCAVLPSPVAPLWGKRRSSTESGRPSHCAALRAPETERRVLWSAVRDVDTCRAPNRVCPLAPGCPACPKRCSQERPLLGKRAAPEVTPCGCQVDCGHASWSFPGPLPGHLHPGPRGAARTDPRLEACVCPPLSPGPW